MNSFPQSNHPPVITISHRLRKSPYYEATLRWGAKAFTVYNHMLMPTIYESAEADYWNLVNNVTLWDVACERQVELTGPDAYRLAEYMTPRDLSKCRIGQGKYAILTDENGGIVNDPIILRLGENHFWMSLADSDVLLWAKGLAHGLGWKVALQEPDVSPLAIQGPNHMPLMVDLFGDWVQQLKFFRFRETELDEIPLIVARSGWSKQGGFELYLRDGQYGDQLWERVMATGKKFQLAPATPNTIERIEGGLLSWGNDMTLENNPFELPLAQYCDLDKKAEFIGRDALQKIRNGGVTQQLVGLQLEGEPILSCEHPWPMFHQNKPCGKVTSATYSPRLEKNIAYGMVAVAYRNIDTSLNVLTPWGEMPATVVPMPFIP